MRQLFLLATFTGLVIQSAVPAMITIDNQTDYKLQIEWDPSSGKRAPLDTGKHTYSTNAKTFCVLLLGWYDACCTPSLPIVNGRAYLVTRIHGSRKRQIKLSVVENWWRMFHFAKIKIASDTGRSPAVNVAP